MTRMEYITRKAAIDEQMKQTRREESRQRKAVDDARLDLDKQEFQAYLDHKHQRQLECQAKCEEISEHFKDLRRALWTQDVQLVEEWRAGLRQDEVTVKGGEA